MRHASPQLLICWLSLALVGLVLAVYWPVGEFDFVRIDDPDYVWSNPTIQQGLTWEGFRWAFTTGHTGNWHPISWLAHMADVQMFGIADPGKPQPGHHLMSVALHVINSGLLLIALWMLTGSVWRSAAVAMIFAVHPVRVESVAWVAERKDVLSTFFGLLTILAYARWIRKRQSGGVPTYIFMAMCYALGLLAKPMLVTLPCVLLLLDIWPLRRLRLFADRSHLTIDRPAEPGVLGFRKQLIPLLVEKIPLFALAAASCIVTYIVQNRVGAVAVLERLPVSARVGNALVSYVRYLGKTLWPSDLVLQYPHPMSWPAGHVLGAGAIVLLITSICFVRLRKQPYLLVGWLWFLGALMPVIGIVQVGMQSMADRYMYVPQIGLLIMIVWSVADFARSELRQGIAIVALLVTVTTLAVAARAQVLVWRNTETLCRHAIKATPNNWMMHRLLGLWHLSRREHAGAAGQFEIAARLNPEDAETASNLGDMLALRGQSAQAIDAYRKALDIQPDRPNTLNNFAVILATSADSKLRNGPLAVRLSTRACELTHFKHAGNLFTLAAAYAESGQFGDAVRTAEQARDLASKADQTALVADIDLKLELFRAEKPSREMFLDPEAAR